MPDMVAGQTPTSAGEDHPSAARRLRALFESDWEETLREAPTFASHLGDPRYNDRWPDVSPEAIARRQTRRRERLRELRAIPVDELSTADRLDHRLFGRQLEVDIAGEPFQAHLMPLDMRGGIQDESSLADSLSFDDVKAYDDWLRRIETFPVYLQQTIALLRAGIAAKIVQPQVVMRRVPAQIRRQIVDDPTASLFYKPFLSFPPTVPEGDRQRLTAAAQAAIRDRVVPAFREFLTFFEREYLPNCFDGIGAWRLPRGDDYYAYRAQSFTTTRLTPREIHDIGKQEVARLRAAMEEILREVKFTGDLQEFFAHLRQAPEFYYEQPDDLLTAYQAFCKRVDPQLPKLFKTLPRIPYGVEPIPEHMAPDTTAAYYRPPAADGSRAGTYFVNLYQPKSRPKYEIAALSLHEAVPGHHLQLALSTELVDVPNFRRFSDFTVYIEGWALYAESLGHELGVYDDPYVRLGALTYEMWRAVRLVVDTGIHSLKWSRDEAINYFRDNAAKSELDIVNEIDRYIGWPGQALAYKIGELKLQELRRRAKTELGDRFDLRAFHDVILSSGSVPLDVLEEQVTAWIASEAAGNE
jgi:prolyl oligopeptidase